MRLPIIIIIIIINIIINKVLIKLTVGSLNDQGQIYLMPDCFTVTLNNAFEHAQYLEIIFGWDQDARLHKHIQEQNGWLNYPVLSENH